MAETENANGETFNRLRSVQSKLREHAEKQARAVIDLDRRFAKERMPLCDELRTVARDVSLFWSRAFRNHPKIMKFISPEESLVLQSLVDFNVYEMADDDDGFQLHFVFGDGEYTNRCEVVKKFTYNKDLNDFDVSSADLAWKSGKALVNVRKRKRENEEASTPMLLTKPPSSFFEWLVSSDDRPKLGSTLRESLWPRAIDFYFGGADLEEDEEDEDEEDGDEEVDDEELEYDDGDVGPPQYAGDDDEEEEDDGEDDDGDEDDNTIPLSKPPPATFDDDDEEDDDEDDEEEEEE
eukprot:Plantae.Rhodophyta-Purpureofilum_apyrenoidigerum.ctg28111.p1 GENE.Plantae.Rhodophyta-Purpureofilum_apyrenoidigerum.ctg28111~~Plantae.Rhodophyta-Purpureofilum_apyrenoidigerum.ctg28111.p1  ORF type:complete len:309 (+),score=100.29 Plantae.Rhodophyta-Purpureofilum_apyrenoidigerum.ctg28111:48-929(+)